MHRDLNDIIPPSRRRPIASDGPTSAPMADMTYERPLAREQSPMREATPISETSMNTNDIQPPRRGRINLGSSGRGFPVGTAIVALVVIAACGGVLYAFAGAKVSVIPVSNPITIDADMDAQVGQGDLPFQIISVDKVATANVPAESTVNAQDPATGTIVVTNKQTSAQALIKNTRFASASGLIFRIHDSITIPAGGNVRVPVYADEPGTKYNIGPTTWTVPGLKGGKAYDSVTATSDTAMAGGFSGTRPSVAQATKDKQYAAIQGQLTTELQKGLVAKIPANYVLIPGASFPTYTPQPDTAGASGTVTLAEKGSITAVVFPEDAIARAVAFKSLATYGGQPISFSGVDKLLIKPVDPAIAPDATDFKFNISGSADVLWKVDPDKIAGAVAGKTRDSAVLALKSFPEVDNAVLVIRPFWSSTFPADPKKIKVTVTPKTGPK